MEHNVFHCGVLLGDVSHLRRLPPRLGCGISLINEIKQCLGIKKMRNKVLLRSNDPTQTREKRGDLQQLLVFHQNRFLTSRFLVGSKPLKGENISSIMPPDLALTLRSLFHNRKRKLFSIILLLI